MPYIKLGNTRINYSSTSDTFIITSIIDSSSSYQYPVLVRDKTTLDIYFGKKFRQRNYFEELLSMNSTLYLYRPVSCINKVENPEPPEGLNPDELPDGWQDIVYENLFLPENSKSWYNRDTLRIFHPGTEYSFDYCYPEYGKNYDEEIITDEEKNNIDKVDSYQLENDYQTFSYVIDFTNVSTFYPEPSLQRAENLSNYIVLPANGKNYMIWFRYNKNSSQPPIGGDYIGSTPIEIKLYDSVGRDRSKDDIINEFLGILQNDFSEKEPYGLGFKLDEDLSSGYKYVLYRYYQDNNNNFFKLPGLTIESSFRKNNDILSVLSRSVKRLEFYSKTIGLNDEYIKINIQPVEYYTNSKYRITISRFEYEEVYEVDLFDEYDKDNNLVPLESTINKSSKLVSCKLFKYDDKGIINTSPLPTGTYYLKGSYTENYNSSMRRESLELIKSTEINDDILLIDDIYLWSTSSELNSNDLETFLDYSKYKDNQVLIANRNDEYLYNYNKNNLDNRLVYFYGDIYYYSDLRPPYYIFLKGLLTDVFSVEEKRIIYNEPDESITSDLKLHKSNYLLNNNHYYYYYGYFDANENGDFNTRITTRFIISKIGREFKKAKWRLISKIGNDRTIEINSIVSTLVRSYSFIKSLTVTSISENNLTNNLEINLTLYVSELVDKNISLNIVLNYNKN